MFFKFLAWLILLIQPFLVPICFVVAWSLVLLTVWRLFSATRDTVQQAKQMHLIPCANCRFFTGEYNLKCPVHPMSALSEDAIDCPDFYSRLQS